MTRKKTHVFAGLIFLTLLVAWSVFIYARSAKTAVESSEESAFFISIIAGILDDRFEQLSPEERHEYTEQLQFYARKFAHFSAYALLGFLGAAAAACFSINKLVGFIYAIIFAASDEIHQYFVPGRSCELRDFLIDAAGAALGVAVVAAICGIYKAIKQKRRKH